MGIRIKVQNARISFAEGLSTPSAFEPGQALKYNSDFLLVPGSTVLKKVDQAYVKSTIEQVLIEVATETWKTKEAGMNMLKSLESSRKSVRRGDTRVSRAGEVYEGYAGILYIAAKSKTKPMLLDRAGQPLTDEHRGMIYSGCYVNAIIDIYGIADPKRKGVFAGLNAVQFVKDGDAFAGGAPVQVGEDGDLGALDEEEKDDLVGAYDDDIPF